MIKTMDNLLNQSYKASQRTSKPPLHSGFSYAAFKRYVVY